MQDQIWIVFETSFEGEYVYIKEVFTPVIDYTSNFLHQYFVFLHQILLYITLTVTLTTIKNGVKTNKNLAHKLCFQTTNFISFKIVRI